MDCKRWDLNPYDVLSSKLKFELATISTLLLFWMAKKGWGLGLSKVLRMSIYDAFAAVSLSSIGLVGHESTYLSMVGAIRGRGLRPRFVWLNQVMCFQQYRLQAR